VDAPDPVAILSALGWQAEGPITPVAGGWDNHLWRFVTADGRRHALRVYRAYEGRDPAAAAHTAANEAAAMNAARAAGLPAPAVEALSDYNGAPCFILEWMPGVPMLDALGSRPWRLERLGREFGRLQARLHRADPAGLRELRAEDLRGIIPDEDLNQRVIRELSGRTFCHLDYHPINVLVDKGKLSAILDFTPAAVTDLRLDLAMTKAALLVAPLPPSPLNPLLQVVRRLLARAWERGYRLEAGAFPLTPLFEAAAISRFVVETRRAVDEGRGWATAKDVAAMERAYERALAAAGRLRTTPEA